MNVVSLRREIFFTIFLVMLVFLSGYILINAKLTYDDEVAQVEEVVGLVTKGASLATQEALWNLSTEDIVPIFEAYFIHKPIVTIRALDENGKVFFEKRKSERSNDRLRLKKAKVFKDQKMIGSLEIEYSIDFVWQRVLMSVLSKLAAMIAFFGILSAVLVYLLHRKIVAPLEELRNIALINESKQNSQPFQSDSPNEIGKLATTLEEFRLNSKQVTDNLEKLVAQKTAQLVQSSKLSSLGEMAAGVAHEINNPMAVILGNAEVLKEHLGDQADEFSAKKLDKIMNMVTRVSKIVKGLKQFSRDAHADEMIVVPVSKIINEVLELCQQKLKNASVEVEVKVPEVEAFIKCREVQMSQVLLNLVQNAADAIAELPERWIKISCESVNSMNLQIRVMDSGRGIPPEILPKLFEPFFTTKEIGKGTGLGLSISAGIVKDHGGSLTVDELAPHTCFVLTLPSVGVFERGARDAA